MVSKQVLKVTELTRQVNVIQSLLRNWTEYEDLVSKANDSGGTSLKNQEIWASSLQGKVQELGVTWDSIWTNSLDSSFLKGLTDIGIGVSSLIDELGGLNTVLLGISGIAIFKNLAWWTIFNIVNHKLGLI